MDVHKGPPKSRKSQIHSLVSSLAQLCLTLSTYSKTSVTHIVSVLPYPNSSANECRRYYLAGQKKMLTSILASESLPFRVSSINWQVL